MQTLAGAVLGLAALLPDAPAMARQADSPPDYRRLEDEIAADVNRYRAQLGLPAVARSPALDQVAQAHVQDLAAHHPDRGADTRGLACNTHSWSAHGAWSAVCYTGDHAYAQGMWRKPAEITGRGWSRRSVVFRSCWAAELLRSPRPDQRLGHARVSHRLLNKRADQAVRMRETA